MRPVGPRIPMVPLALGAAGLIPFVWGVVVTQTGALALPFIVAPQIAVQAYGLMIFCFMAGCLWGFAAKAEWMAGHVLSVLPVLAFMGLAAVGLPIGAVLIACFVGLLPLDYLFARRDMTPGWWMKLRLGLSAVVVASLIAI